MSFSSIIQNDIYALNLRKGFESFFYLLTKSDYFFLKYYHLYHLLPLKNVHSALH